MESNLSSEDRRDVRTSLIASLAFVAAFLSGSFAWAGVNAPGAGARTPSLAAAAPTAPAALGAAQDNDDLGCGCDEACLVAN